MQPPQLGNEEQMLGLHTLLCGLPKAASHSRNATSSPTLQSKPGNLQDHDQPTHHRELQGKRRETPPSKPQGCAKDRSQQGSGSRKPPATPTRRGSKQQHPDPTEPRQRGEAEHPPTPHCYQKGKEQKSPRFTKKTTPSLTPLQGRKKTPL